MSDFRQLVVARSKDSRSVPTGKVCVSTSTAEFHNTGAAISIINLEPRCRCLRLRDIANHERRDVWLTNESGTARDHTAISWSIKKLFRIQKKSTLPVLCPLMCCDPNCRTDHPIEKRVLRSRRILAGQKPARVECPRRLWMSVIALFQPARIENLLLDVASDVKQGPVELARRMEKYFPHGQRAQSAANSGIIAPRGGSR